METISLITALSLLLKFFLFSLRTATAAPNFIFILCQNTNNTYSPNSTYESNLNALFPVLSSNATAVNGFYNFTAGRSPPDVAYGLFLCRGDVSLDVCRDCVSTATKEVVPKCPRQKEVTIWYDECMLRYSNQSIFGVSKADVMGILRNLQNVTDPTQNATGPNRFRMVMGGVMSDVANRASNSQTGKKFATQEANFTALQTLYGLGQCTPDLTALSCDGCLRSAINQFPSCCDLNQGARILFPSCNVRYELYPFYNVTATAVAPPPSPVLSPPPPPPRPTSTSGKRRLSSQILIAIIVPVGVSVLLFIVGICFISRKTKKRVIIQEDIVDNDFTTARSLQYDLGTIQAATNNFSDENKIGEGGYGLVYKGTLTDDKEIAVKRLSQNSGQGAVEFKNEVLLVAKLEHRNLVRLLGFCLEGEEKILIYEFIPNKSLDYFLFDPQGQERLDWPRRYKIIGGIARGMLYLHEDSQLRIIHRDLKASNVLLDRDMNAKISDFGMARIVNVDQTRGTTSRVVGTFGYMSPEYVMHGQFSVKSDVFSFGVLVLEIISGKKNNSFFLPDSSEDLLSYAWKLWREETPLDLLDPTLERSYSRSEVIRCIHIGLLCVQEDPDARPSMATVVLMLNSYSVTMSVPQQPAFFPRSRTDHSSIPKGLVSDQSTSKSIPFSMNEASITELYPR